MKSKIILLFLFITIALFANDSDLREFVSDVESVKKAVEAARIVHFVELRLAPIFERKEDEFYFTSQKNAIRVVFKSKRLALLCNKLASSDEFSRFIGRSTVFGIRKADNLIEGRLLVSFFCTNNQCLDEEYAMFVADD